MKATQLINRLAAATSGMTHIKQVVVATEVGCMSDHINLQITVGNHAADGGQGHITLRNSEASWQVVETLAHSFGIKVTHEHRDWDDKVVSEWEWIDSPARLDRIKTKEIASHEDRYYPGSHLSRHISEAREMSLAQEILDRVTIFASEAI